MAKFVEMLRDRWQKVNSMVCVGLDSDYEKMSENFRKFRSPAQAILDFNKAIIKETHAVVCAFKPNAAFYESEWDHPEFGAALPSGLSMLERSINFMRETAEGIPIIFDAKRTDIGNTNKGYAKMAFDQLGADAITVNPYFGGEALAPFFDRADKGVFVLCRTSNPGAREFQDLLIAVDHLPEKARKFFKNFKEGSHQTTTATHVHLFEYVAYQATYEWNKNGNVVLVAGATYPGELMVIRKIVGDMPILVPGIGAQGGELEATVKAGLDSAGFGMIINSARGIIFASKGEDFAEAAAREAKKLREQINIIKKDNSQLSI